MWCALAPVPWRQFVEPGCGMIADACEHVGQPRPWIDIVQPGGDDQAVECRSPLAASIRAREQPGLAPDRDAAQGAFCRVVADADPPVVEEPTEGRPTLEHIIHRPADIVLTRELEPRLPHPLFQFADQHGTLLASCSQTLICRRGIDRALDGKDRIDPPHRLDRQCKAICAAMMPRYEIIAR